jgi:hypothetical protein
MRYAGQQPTTNDRQADEPFVRRGIVNYRCIMQRQKKAFSDHAL